MELEQEKAPKKISWLGIGAILAAIGASLCCVAPLLLLSLGIGGAWMSTLTSMQAVRPFFFILSLIFIALGYRKLYWVPENCAEGELCILPNNMKRQRTIFWLGSMFILLLLAFPWYAPYFM
jgi:mercuric ion transport protein